MEKHKSCDLWQAFNQYITVITISRDYVTDTFEYTTYDGFRITAAPTQFTRCRNFQARILFKETSNTPYVDSPPANGNLEGAHVARLRSSFTRFSLVENSSLFLSANDPRRRLTAAAQTLRGRENRMHLQSSISVPWPQRPKPSPAVSAYYKQSKYTSTYTIMISPGLVQS